MCCCCDSWPSLAPWPLRMGQEGLFVPISPHLLFFSPVPAPRLLHCLSRGKGATGGFLLNIWVGCPSALSSFGSERKPAEGDRTCPWPYLFLAFPRSPRKMRMVATQVSRVD